MVRIKKRQDEYKEEERQQPQSSKGEISLYEKTEAVKSLWNQIVFNHYQRDVGFVTEISLKEVAAWFVKEDIAPDLGKAKIAIKNEIGKLSLEKQELMTFDEFSRLFTKGVVKKALIDVADRFEANKKEKGGSFEGIALGS